MEKEQKRYFIRFATTGQRLLTHEWRELLGRKKGIMHTVSVNLDGTHAA